MKRIIIVLIMCGLIFNPAGHGWDKVSAASKPAASAIISLTSGSGGKEGEVTAKWKKISADGYQIQYSQSKGFAGAVTWSTTSASAVSRSFTGLEKGKIYYFRVRTVRKSGSSKLYSSWSSGVQIEAHEHIFSSHVTDEASCGKSGDMLYTCNGCSYSYHEELSPLTHNYSRSVTKKATAKAAGIATYSCSRCKDSYTQTIPKLSASSSAKSTDKGKTAGSSSKQSVSKSKQTDKATAKPAAKQVQTSAAATKPAETSKPVSESKAADNVQDDKAASVAKPLSAREKTIKAREAAVSWAVSIADDNDFHYGRSKWAHKSGCYFCGTNQKAGSGKRRGGASLAECARTYCCNPFVTAAYHHGAGASEIDCRVRYKRINLANDRNRALNNKKAFKRISKPSGVSSLCPGDILLTPTHCMLYAGDGKVVHAAHHDNGKRGSYWNSSIVCEKISSRQWKRTSKIYRYIGTGKF